MRVIGLGEMLLRISPPGHFLFSQTDQLQSQFGGAEFNVLGGLSCLGYETALVTSLPDSSIGQSCLQFIRKQGVGTQFVTVSGQRLGLYFYERGIGSRPSRICYDRLGSAFAQLTADHYDWTNIFQGADWFHVSGVTVALSPNLYQMTLTAMERARALGVKISFDLNYRESLWPSFEEARKALAPFVELADCCIGLEPLCLPDDSAQDRKDVLGLTRPYDNREVLIQVVQELSHYYELKSLAFTQREIVGNRHRLQGFLYQNGRLYETPVHETPVVDRVGTGDAFTTGLIFGQLEGRQGQELLNTAMASFVYKHTIEGDVGLLTRSQLDQLITNQQSDISR